SVAFALLPTAYSPLPHSWLTAASAASDDAALGHGAGVERAARLVFAEVAQFDHDLEDRPVLGHGALRNLGALLIADDRVERGDEDRVLAEPALGLLAVGGHADNALVGKGVHRADGDVHHLEQVVRDDRHHHVQFKLTRLPRQHHGEVVAHHVEHRHVEHLRQHGVDL